jgi:hypothetical protein
LLDVSDFIGCFIQFHVGFLRMWRKEGRRENEVVVSQNNVS